MRLTRSNTLLAAILLLAAALRFYNIGAQSFWYDEGNSARIAERSVRLIIEGAGADIHPPGYYLLLKLWRFAFGESEAALRAFSAVCGVLMVWVVWRMGNLVHERIGMVAAFLVAVSPFAIYYSQEARMYALLALCAATSSWALAEAAAHEKRTRMLWLGAYVIATVAGLYTQYAYPFVMLAQGVWVALASLPSFGALRADQTRKSRQATRVRLACYALASALAILAFAPWIPIALRQIQSWPAQAEGYAFAPALLDVARWLVVGRTLPLAAAALPLILAVKINFCTHCA